MHLELATRGGDSAVDRADAADAPGADGEGGAAVDEQRYRRRIAKAKRAARSELRAEQWSRMRLAELEAEHIARHGGPDMPPGRPADGASNGGTCGDGCACRIECCAGGGRGSSDDDRPHPAGMFWIPPQRDSVPRIDAARVSPAEFVAEWEAPGRPVVIRGVSDEWPASTAWMPEAFVRTYRNQKFKVGQDDEGDKVTLAAKYYMRYALTDPDGARADDSPLYIFDASVFKSAPQLARDYTVPEYFRDDLFRLVGSSRRPPYRWIVMGPARSGTGIHIDPLGTSAWNTLLLGHKRWALFPPGTAKDKIDPKLKDREAVTWFMNVYPKLRAAGEDLGMVEIIQRPGETVFVPGGWAHVVMNLGEAHAAVECDEWFWGHAS
ncbi:hypothetical protein HK105_201882 [Polyrhizophydium stewartii]|uniref:JmjC domain-containing protein n=1 Tax=Polyrhizophydium stewartii TaxID=2732419 RepID=A0ABR4NGA4_9FUNG